ncbi:unnamed protein product [Amoebophrya sp. A120]|nr:unnamed protein product [Amoebophrya sp. A120]|eukprot:GSA120T00017779001.1
MQAFTIGDRISVDSDGIRRDERFASNKGMTSSSALFPPPVADERDAPAAVSMSSTSSDDGRSATDLRISGLFTHPSCLSTVVYVETFDTQTRTYRTYTVDMADAQYQRLGLCTLGDLEPFSIRDENDCHLGERLTFWRRPRDASCRSAHVATSEIRDETADGMNTASSLADHFQAGNKDLWTLLGRDTRGNNGGGDANINLSNLRRNGNSANNNMQTAASNAMSNLA